MTDETPRTRVSKVTTCDQGVGLKNAFGESTRVMGKKFFRKVVDISKHI